MKKRNIYLQAALLFMLSSPVYAQFHFKGCQGISISSGVKIPEETSLGLDFHHFLSRRFQLELGARYTSAEVLAQTSFHYYDVEMLNQQQLYDLQQRLYYSFVKLFGHVYLNAGAGLLQRYESLDRQQISYQINTLRLSESSEEIEFDQAKVREKNEFAWGGQLSMMMEVYLGRHINLMANHSYYRMVSQARNREGFGSVLGVRINF